MINKKLEQLLRPRVEKYHGFDIHTFFKVTLPTNYWAKFTCKDDKGEFILLHNIPVDFLPTVEPKLKPEEAVDILYRVGLEQVRKLIDSQQFEYGKEYDKRDVNPKDVR